MNKAKWYVINPMLLSNIRKICLSHNGQIKIYLHRLRKKKGVETLILKAFYMYLVSYLKLLKNPSPIVRLQTLAQAHTQLHPVGVQGRLRHKRVWILKVMVFSNFNSNKPKTVGRYKV